MGSGTQNKALLLDRDGVINVEKSYVWRIEDFEFLPGIFDLCHVGQALGLIPIVATNQAGIGRGYYTEQDFQALTEWMLGAFRARGIDIGRVYHCPYHPTAGVGEYHRDSFDRKPNPGMIFRAQDDFNLDLARSVLVGNKDSDIQAGRAAGVGYNLRLLHYSDAGRAPDRTEFGTLQAIGDWLARTFSRPAPG
jgi:D-glycero-D-manno-heptose 1,7-bisphosphate phosphatase